MDRHPSVTGGCMSTSQGTVGTTQSMVLLVFFYVHPNTAELASDLVK